MIVAKTVAAGLEKEAGARVVIMPDLEMAAGVPRDKVGQELPVEVEALRAE